MNRSRPVLVQQAGFTIVEIIISIFVFGIIVSGFIDAYNSLRFSYSTARQYNEIYTVLSACPEIDRALTFDSLSSTTNCYPNNTFPAEDGYGGTITYTPNLTVTNTTSLPASDPLSTVPDSKVVAISVPFQRPNQNNPQLQLRMLVTRNGIGQQ